jgi:hypothetical protein
MSLVAHRPAGSKQQVWGRSVAFWVAASLALTAPLALAGYLVFAEVMMRAVFRAG